ncbi:GIY-YIG nuclease family protein [Christiangramia fulva]|uniref:GIY-YIG nuclease family protein n=1 Tax=Christiangramia fulva TaxID=2126553 RepID=UPI00187674F4|nr:hypothetical protein [Christiangramia fulva]
MEKRTKFTQQEIDILESLIKKRIKADRTEQKSIRNKMRKLGFYGSYFGISDLQPSDLQNLIRSRRITIVDHNKENNLNPEIKKTVVKEQGIKTSEEFEFLVFNPQKSSITDIPNEPGNYIVCLNKNSKLPEIGIEPELTKFKGLEVIYTGIAGTSLRKRDFKQHFTGNNAGTSTLRKSIGLLFGFDKIPRDKDPNTGKTKFKYDDELKLSEWMNSNLTLYFISNHKHNELENELIKKLNPPLNLSKNKSIINQDYRKKLSRLRRA